MTGITRFSRFSRYLAVGAAATAVHYALLVALVELAACPAPWAAALGAWVGAQVAFVGNARITFGSSVTAARWLRFQIVAALGAVLSYAIVRAGVALGWHYLFGQVVATGVTVVVTYEANRRWSFAPEPGASSGR